MWKAAFSPLVTNFLSMQENCYTVKHPATLGAQLADAFSKEFGGAAFVVNPPDVDEFQDVARVTGLKGVYRESRIHALNQKEIGIRFAAKQGKKYEDMNLIICHIGGGISVTAHRMGKMVDSMILQMVTAQWPPPAAASFL